MLEITQFKIDSDETITNAADMYLTIILQLNLL